MDNAQRVVELERISCACKMRARGVSWEDIAFQLEFKSVAQAQRRVASYMRKVQNEARINSEILRQIEVLQLDQIRQAAYEILDGSMDPEVKLRALNVLLSEGTQRARLQGLNAPEQSATSVTMRYEVGGIEDV